MTRVSSGIDRRRLLVDPAADHSFRAEGFAVVPLVRPERLERLQMLVAEFVPPDASPFFGLYRNDDPSVRPAIDAVVREELAVSASRQMQNHRFYIGSLLVKYPGEDSFLDAHRDWSFVDEMRYVSGIVWLPLAATDEHTGCLLVSPGSHRVDAPFRGTPPRPLEVDEGELVACSTEPGEAVIYHNALIHASSRNESRTPRVVMALGFVSEDADLVHFRTDDRRRTWRYTVSDTFPFDYRPPAPPCGPTVLRTQRWRDGKSFRRSFSRRG